MINNHSEYNENVMTVDQEEINYQYNLKLEYGSLAIFCGPHTLIYTCKKETKLRKRNLNIADQEKSSKSRMLT